MDGSFKARGGLNIEAWMVEFICFFFVMVSVNASSFLSLTSLRGFSSDFRRLDPAILVIGVMVSFLAVCGGSSISSFALFGVALYDNAAEKVAPGSKV